MELGEAIKILGFKKNGFFTETEVKEKFRKLVKEKHPEGNKFKGGKHNMADLVDAKKTLLNNILHGNSNNDLEERDIDYWIRKINRMLKNGAPKEAVLENCGFDFLKDFATELCYFARTLDFENFHYDGKAYDKEQHIFFTELEKFKTICFSLKYDDKPYLRIIGKVYLCYYLNLIKDFNEYNRKEFRDIVNSFFEACNDFKVEDKKDFIFECLNNTDYITFSKALKDDIALYFKEKEIEDIEQEKNNTQVKFNF